MNVSIFTRTPRNWKKIMLISTIVTVFTLTVALQINSVVTHLLSDPDNRVTLKTLNSGSFVGRRVTELKDNDPNALPRSYFSFRGIPYAKAGRWEPPKPVEVRKAPRIATNYKPPCPQWDVERKKVIGSQDCLYLNVFTPYVPSSVRHPIPSENVSSWTATNKNLLPVLVYFHGGEFIAGGSHLYGPERFMKEDVVFVTVNYRLGILGFLTNGEESLSGNYGLLDMIESLRWLRDNIYRFGGNPQRICIFGNVEYLLLAQDEGLFQSAIITSVSTSIFTPNLHNNEDVGDPKELFHLVAREAACPKDDELALECLNLLEVDSIVRIQHRLQTFFHYPRYQGLGPLVDKEWKESPLIPDENLLRREFVNSIPIMIGQSAYEGFNLFFEFYLKLGVEREDKLEDEEFIKDRLRNTLELILDDNSFPHFANTFNTIWAYYFGPTRKSQDRGKVLWKLFRIFGDISSHVGQRKLAKLISSNSNAPVYNYVFTVQFTAAEFMAYLNTRLNSTRLSGINSTILTRSLHSTRIPPWKELFYLFEPLDEEIQQNLINAVNQTEPELRRPTREFTPQREKLSSFLVKLWVSFAKYGEVKYAMESTERKWIRGNSNNLNYFVLGDKFYPLQGDFRKTESKFWLSTVPQIHSLSKRIQELEPYPSLFRGFLILTVIFAVFSVLLGIWICYNLDKQRDKGIVYYG